LGAAGGKVISLAVPVNQLDDATRLLGKALALMPDRENG